jgi:hypothetical protein
MTGLAGRAGARGARDAAALLRAARAATAAAAEQPPALARAASTAARELPGALLRDPQSAPPRAFAAHGALDPARFAAPHRGFSAQAAPAAPVNPFAIVSDELEAVSERMRAAVVSEARRMLPAPPPRRTLTPRARAFAFRRRCPRLRRRRSTFSKKGRWGSGCGPPCSCWSPLRSLATARRAPLWLPSTTPRRETRQRVRPPLREAVGGKRAPACLCAAVPLSALFPCLQARAGGSSAWPRWRSSSTWRRCCTTT